MKEKIKDKKIIKKMTIDDLAIILKNSFDSVDRRFDAVDERFNANDQRFDAMDQRFDAMDQRFDEMKDDLETIKDELITTNDRIDFLSESRVSNEGFSILKNRVTLLEKSSK